jgi:antitoxin (DNA-binding transcriptional repressor) of toxin-antitoxin stability system
MGTYSIAEAKNQLSKLIGRALAGEVTVITRRDQPVIGLRPIHPRPMAKAELDWLRARREGRKRAKTDAGTLVTVMRNKDWRH